MKTAPLFSLCRAIAGLAAGAALLCASGASAQTNSPYYSFQVNNLTFSNGDATFPVYDSVTFDTVDVNEVFADGFTQTIALGDLQTLDTVQSSAQFLSAAGGGFTDPIHGGLTSADLTGTLQFPGITPDPSGVLNLTILTDPNATSYQQAVYTPFSASLLGPNPTGINVGTFSLLNSDNVAVDTVKIEVQAVPETSTVVSMGLLLALGLGSLVIARRRTAAAN